MDSDFGAAAAFLGGKTATPANFPRVSAALQTQRDTGGGDMPGGDRLRILQDELAKPESQPGDHAAIQSEIGRVQAAAASGNPFSAGSAGTPQGASNAPVQATPQDSDFSAAAKFVAGVPSNLAPPASLPAKTAQPAQAQPSGFLNRIGAAVEPYATIGTGLVGQAVGGLAGLAAGGDADVVRNVSSALTYQPQTEGGKASLAGLSNIVGHAGEFLNTPVNTPLGDINPISRYNAESGRLADIGHPLLATVRQLIPQALGMVAGGPARNAVANVAADIPRAADAIATAIPKAVGNVAAAVSKAPSAALNAADNAAAAMRTKLGLANPAPAVGSVADFPPAPVSTIPSTAPSQIAIPKFEPPTAPPETGKLPPIDRAARANTLQEIGLNPEQHPSAVTGDQKIAATEFQESKLLGARGDAQKQIINQEQGALRDYGSQIIDDTGGTPGASPDARGHAIIAPLKGLNDHFENAINSLYSDARNTAGDLPAVQPDNLHALLNDSDFQSTLLSSQDGTALLGQIKAQAGRFAGLTEDGVAPTTVNDAEKFRQWLNSVSKPSNSRQIGMVKQAIDSDVATAGGEGTFDKARQIFGLKKDTLDNPNGIASILNEEGPDGINRRVPFEKVPAKIVDMPNDQFGHIVSTLQNVPDELQPSAQKALAEIKAEMAERMVGAGTLNGTAQSWRPFEFTKAANKFQDKIPALFSDDEIAHIKTLNDAGHILWRDKSYPGADIQKQNLAVRGAQAALPAVGGSVGAALGGPFGGAVGMGAGQAISGGMSNLANIGKAKKILKGVPLSDLLQGR